MDKQWLLHIYTFGNGTTLTFCRFLPRLTDRYLWKRYQKESCVGNSTCLCPASETLMPTKPEALTQRNNNFGKPKLFVQDKGRLLAVGGSRIKSVIQYESLSKPIRIIRPPRLPVVDEEGRIVDKDLQEEFVPFQMSEDYVRLAVRALDTR